MVCVSGGGLSERLIRAARRMADRRHAEWLAVFVETAAFHRLPEAERDRVARVLRLAEQLGGEAVTIPGERVADELIRYAERAQRDRADPRQAAPLPLAGAAGRARR